MPKVYSEMHDRFMTNYFETSQVRILNSPRNVYPVNK